MTSRRIPLVAGNWKMNFDHLEATYFVQQLAWKLRDVHFDHKRCEIALMPSFTSLRSVQVLVESDNLKIRYGAQAVSVTSQGAFTGDVSADMIAHLGCSYVIVGHSERRKYHPEDDANIVDQTWPSPVGLPALSFSGLTKIVKTPFSGTLISDTDPGVLTFTGSFFTNVEVSMKKVSNRVITSDIGVISIQTSLFLIFTLPIAIKF